MRLRDSGLETDKSLEQECLDRLLHRDEKVLVQLKQEFEPYLRGILRNFLDNPSDIDECLNDTYLKIWNSIPPHQPENLRAYMARIARNTALDRLRWNRRGKRQHQETLFAEETVESAGSAEDGYEAIELRDIVNRFLEDLPDRERNMFICRFFYGDDAERIAAMYGLSVPRTYRIISGIVRNFRSYLKKEGISV